MTPLEFASALMAYCSATGASVTSWGRTSAHNTKVGGVPGSAHRFWCGADVVYDQPINATAASAWAARLGLKLIRESDHDHLQPAGWPAG